MNKTPEHPEIEMALRTGYPKIPGSVQCADCGADLFGDTHIYESDGDLICGECLKERILDKYSIADLAAAFDIPGTTVAEHLAQEGRYGVL